MDLPFASLGDVDSSEPSTEQRNYRLHNVCLDDFSDEYLKSRYRFGRESKDFLVDLLSDDQKRRTARSYAISPLVQFLVSLRYYASGSFLEVTGNTFGQIQIRIQAPSAKNDFVNRIKWISFAKCGRCLQPQR